MTLYRQLFAGMSALFLVLLLGVHALYLTNARTYLQQQLVSHAQDTATSIAMSLASRGSLSNEALVEAVISPTFDRGYFASIEVTSLTGAAVAERRLPTAYGDVPDWFTTLFRLDSPGSDAIITAGWQQLGRVAVVSQPHFAYQQLWHTAIATLAYLAAAYAATLFGMRLFLRSILRPLQAIEAFAQAVGRRDYRPIALLPSARELRRVVGAINCLAGKIRHAIEEESARAERMRQEAREDVLTGLCTRRAFEQEYETLIAGQDIYAVTLALIELEHVKALNEHRGRARTDELLARTAQAVRSACSDHGAIAGRLAGTHYAIAVVNADAMAASRLLAGLTSQVAACLASEFASDGIEFHCGAVHSDAATPPLSSLLAAADHALACARGRESGAFELNFWNETPEASLGSGAWRSAIHDALAADRYALYAQDVLQLPGRETLHTEIFVRQVDEHGVPLAAAMFMPMVARHGLLPRLDIVIAEKLFAHLGSRPASDARVALNVAAQTVADDASVTRLEHLLREHPRIASRLVFEMTEFGAAHDPEAARRFAARVRILGAGYALDNFSLSRAGLALLPQLLPDYVKLAAEFTATLMSSAETQFLITSLSRIVESLEIRLVAQAVEYASMLERLQALGVTGYQGYVTGAPRPLV
jgi:EAL domain-containing protein (putative c-di-GMP-specific phosphodiesterase class I)/GGDEF domain-containing protein